MAKPVNEREIANAIVKYLRSHPGAEDTVEGITQSWLPGTSVVLNSQAVQKALQLLATDGVLERVSNAGAKDRYRLRQ